MRHEWQRTRDPTLKKSVNLLCRKIKWELDFYRINQYRQFAENLMPGDKELWTETRRLTGHPTEIFTLNDGTQTAHSDDDKSQLLARHLSNKFNNNDRTDNMTEQLVQTYLAIPLVTAEPNLNYITPSEITYFISRLALKKAPGDDLIPNVVLKNLPKKSIALMTSVFNACLRFGYFPNQWKNSIIVVFHKPGKPKESPNSYRPISLLNTLAKILEKCIEKRLRDHLEANNVIPEHQFGFKPLHSSVHQVQRTAEHIYIGFEEKKYTAAVFLDVSDAFDTVWHDALLFKLKQTWPPRYLMGVISSFLSNRSFQVRVNNSLSRKMPITAGVPQGAILSPLLFTLYCSDIPEPPTTTLSMYADDTLVMSQGSEILETVEKLQVSLDTITAWFDQWKLRLNPLKTEAKIFALRRFHEEDITTLQLDGRRIPWNARDRSVRYLGVHLDTRLTWRLHTNIKLQQAHTRLRLLYPLINRNTPLKYQCSVLLYKTLLLPILTYACPVWYGTSNSNRRRLQTFQNKILRLTLNAPSFVRNSQIHQELGVDPIADHIKELTRRHYERLPLVQGAAHYRLGATIAARLKPKVYQDIHQ